MEQESKNGDPGGEVSDSIDSQDLERSCGALRVDASPKPVPMASSALAVALRPDHKAPADDEAS